MISLVVPSHSERPKALVSTGEAFEPIAVDDDTPDGTADGVVVAGWGGLPAGMYRDVWLQIYTNHQPNPFYFSYTASSFRLPPTPLSHAPDGFAELPKEPHLPPIRG